MAATGVLELTDATFDQAIASADKPVLVDFWAEWCAPCRRVGPIVDELAGQAIIAKVDIDSNQEVAARLSVHSIPTLMVFKGGEMKERLVGAQPKPVLLEVLKRFI